MEQPSGFVAQGKIGKVCRLWNPRAWFGKYSQAIETLACRRVSLATPFL